MDASNSHFLLYNRDKNNKKIILKIKSENDASMRPKS